jgi:hypothetical protein
MMSYSQMIDSPRIAAKRSQLEPGQRLPPVANEDKSMECELEEEEDDATSNCASCASRPYPASPQVQQRHSQATSWSWRGDEEDAEIMSSSASCLPPSNKKQRRTSSNSRDGDEGMMASSHTYSRRDSSSSVSSFTSQQSGHRKSRNRAFTGQDFQRLIISQF